jgi:hypothetical protein
MISQPEGTRHDRTGEVFLTNSQVRHVVMLTVAGAWLVYVLVGILRNQLPEVWSWGIPSGVYVALYQPWSRVQNPGGTDGPTLGGPGAPRLGDKDES